VFFVYLGLALRFDFRYLEISIILTGLVGLRYIHVSVLGSLLGFSNEKMVYSRLFFIQGSSSLVLAHFIEQYDPSGEFLANPQLFKNILIPMVISYILFSSLLAPIITEIQTSMNKPMTGRDVRKDIDDKRGEKV